MISVKAAKCKSKNEKEKKLKKRSTKIIVTVGVVAISVVILILVALGKVPDRAYCGDFSYSLLACSQDRDSFFKQFGFDSKLISERQVTVPEEGSSFEEYNELQIEQGLDLRGYGGYEAAEYIYELSREDMKKPFFGMILVYSDRVIAFHFDSFDGSEIKGLSQVLKKQV